MGGVDEDTIEGLFLDRVNNLTEISSKEVFEQERAAGKSWGLLQGTADYEKGNFAAAIRHLADTQDPEGLYMLGTSYRNLIKSGNLDREVSTPLAVEALTLASEKGHALAAYELAKIYYRQSNKENEYVRYMDLAAYRGVPDACEKLARLHALNYLDPLHNVKATIAKKQGMLFKDGTPIQFNEGKEAYEQGNYLVAWAHFEHLVDPKGGQDPKTVAESQYYLARSYQEFLKQALPKVSEAEKAAIRERATTLLKLADEHGLAEATAALGDALYLEAIDQHRSQEKFMNALIFLQEGG